MDTLVDRLASRLMDDVQYESLVYKIPIVFLTADDIRELLLIESNNLNNGCQVTIQRRIRSRPFTKDNIRLEIINFRRDLT